MIDRDVIEKEFSDFTRELAGEACSSRSQAQYGKWHRQSHWNGREFLRFPDFIVKASSEYDVVVTVRFARRMGLAVCVRSGGHSFSGAFLREGGILLDVSQLRQLEFDQKTLQLVSGPGVTSYELSQELAQFGFGFPTGHAGNVGVGGFLLGGGLGINFGTWGPMSAFNIIALDVVTADGELKHVNSDENEDLFWAARGGGPGLFFVVVRFHLTCMLLPAEITTRSLRLPFSRLSSVLSEIERINPDRKLQLMLAVVPTDHLHSDADYGREVILNTIAFADNPAHASALHESVIGRLEESASPEQATSFEAIHRQGDDTFAIGRYRTDNILTDRPEDAVRILASHLSRQPSPQSLPLFIWRGTPELPDAAFSATGMFYFSTYARWSEAKDDDVNRQWLISLYNELQAISSNCYINEFDLEARSSEVKRCFSEHGWRRLRELKCLYDPDNIFHDVYLEKP
ncbi:FAD-binding oxidoreductase [Pseudomonas sp. PDM25]|uniref:FAD-binding oxidoreductase n=1 Tax=Pseudomonas sp. PDM25 TaxID=2854772 RepID=UPI001C44B571|nr:FAD-binding oxidoreductase [Pseudomonas sp. PDM25]MBV7515719.1 FAD-binding oxidoreductase [Pseudomonas sp. PDM25]